ncbi:hypothetical protein Pla52o_57460 [Novipirellula galeiformis]|uniref:Uncharacterized protein n=2 Tax=Novipirellula galeiformis TaxID=2528004 RepID=A0A5C6BE91_9BACT|nr:hypothetical protein Pla52o_57460 [Novipirellula galeiformis]
MPHYRLPSPADPNCRLTKRGATWDSTIYHCTATNSFWMLHMDRHGDRFLYAYLIDGPKPIIDKSQKFPVPEDWTGDPETVYVALESIHDSEMSGDSVNLPGGLREVLDNGDRVLITDFDNAVVGEIIRDGDELRLERRDGYAPS